jgi:phage gp16-like protein
MKRPITKVQIKLIHTAKSRVNMDDETYRELLNERFKVASSKDLSQGQAQALIAHFDRLGFKPLARVRYCKDNDNNVVRLATQLQRQLIEVLRANIYWTRGKAGFGMWLDKRYHIKKVQTLEEAVKVIEGLKGMLKIDHLVILNRELPFPQGEIKPGTWTFDVETLKLVKVEVVNNDNAG